MDDLSSVEDFDANGWIISADRLRKQIRQAQSSGHANAFFQVFGYFPEGSTEEKKVLCITDLYDDRWPTRSVTNDAEYVVRLGVDVYGDMPVIYRDTEGRWDELRHREGYFACFRPLNTRDQFEAVSIVVALHEQDRAQYHAN